MKTKIIKFGLIAFTALLFVALAFFILTAPNINEFNLNTGPEAINDKHPLALLGDLESLSAAASLAAIRTTTDANSSFDEVASYVPKIRRVREALLTSSFNSDNAPSDLSLALTRFISLSEGNEEAIEQFKTNHAAMRNSKRYLPLSFSLVQKMGDNGKYIKELEKLNEINAKVSDFLRTPSSEAKNALTGTLIQFEGEALEFDNKLSNATLNYISHARVLIDRTLPMADVLERIVKGNLREAGKEVLAAYIKLSKSQVNALKSNLLNLSEQQQQALWIALFIGLILTLIAIIGYIWAIKESNSANLKISNIVKKKTIEFEQQLKQNAQSQVNSASDSNMSYVSRMVASLTHEMNTPLSYLSSNMEILQNSNQAVSELISETELSSEKLLNANTDEERTEIISGLSSRLDSLREDSLIDEIPEIMNDMNTGVNQIQHLMDDLKLFSGTDRSSKEWFNLNECINDVLKLSASTIGDDISIVKKLSDIPEFYGSRGKFNQVLTNLINNSAHAIKAANKETKGQLKIITKSNDKVILLEVLDNGIGIDNENSKKIFEPFFTTKGPQEGSGLGLAIVSQIITEHKGKMAMNSKVNQGTVFKILLPIKQS